MGIMRRAAVAVGMLGLLARVGAAQALPAPATHHAPSIETMYKQLGLVAHAAKGQTVDQQKIDGRECYDAAKSKTGFDPPVATSLHEKAGAAPHGKAAA